MFIDYIYRSSKSNTATVEKTESHSRSFIKAVSWRACGTLDTILISWFVSGTWNVAFYIGTFELLTKTVLYYFHERAWNNIKWGR